MGREHFSSCLSRSRFCSLILTSRISYSHLVSSVTSGSAQRDQTFSLCCFVSQNTTKTKNPPEIKYSTLLRSEFGHVKSNWIRFSFRCVLPMKTVLGGQFQSVLDILFQKACSKKNNFIFRPNVLGHLIWILTCFPFRWNGIYNPNIIKKCSNQFPPMCELMREILILSFIRTILH